ncbi:hypothetical protein N7495_001776 [Penicillium taxi]|uniref:uncharacterized protein n=1 Tax=Penicillium taxi TaxID=168475 RepID=UPI00254549A9|nr:uncharacterized protein N7495_001776 [Penicillium taxi]KAJ5909094.1 hypothetical protein N7495_001776 [Penicillium taxi]
MKTSTEELDLHITTASRSTKNSAQQNTPKLLQSRMSSQTTPINPAAFAEAITELPLSAVYSKVLELRNSIAHLHRSNAELRLFLAEYPQGTEEEKKEMEGYVAENEGVIASIEERLSLLKTELENRGQAWEDVNKGSEVTADVPVTNGNGNGDVHSGDQDQSQTLNAGQEEGGVYL